MPGNIFLPPDRTFAENLAPIQNLLTQLALMKVSQNFREQEAAIADLRATTREQAKEKTAAAMEGWRPAEGEEVRAPGAGAVEIGGTKMMPPTPEVIDLPGTDIKALKYQGKITPISADKGESKPWLYPDPNGIYEIKGQKYSLTSTRSTTAKARQLEQVGGFEAPPAVLAEVLGTKPAPTPTDFGVFYSSQKAKGKTDEEITNAWDAIIKSRQQERYLPYTPVPGLPLARWSRKTGLMEAPNPVTGQMEQLDYDKYKNLYGEGAALDAGKKVYKDLTEREQLIKTFVQRIDANTPIAEKLAKELGNTDIRLLNVPINTLAQRGVGSGTLSSLQLALYSIGGEVAKVEAGQLGISGASVDQLNYMKDKIFDVNLSVNDLLKVLKTGRQLGGTASDAITKQRATFKKSSFSKTVEESGGPAEDPLGLLK